MALANGHSTVIRWEWLDYHFADMFIKAMHFATSSVFQHYEGKCSVSLNNGTVVNTFTAVWFLLFVGDPLTSPKKGRCNFLFRVLKLPPSIEVPPDGCCVLSLTSTSSVRSPAITGNLRPSGMCNSHCSRVPCSLIKQTLLIIVT